MKLQPGDLKAAGIIGCIAALLWLMVETERRVLGVDAVPTASSSVTIPLTGTLSGSVKDDAGNTWTAAQNVTTSVQVVKTEPEPAPGPTPTTIIRVETAGGAAVVIEGTSGQSLELVGTGFPLAGQRRLVIAGQTCPVTLWRADRAFFTLPNVTQTFSGNSQIWLQIANTWTSLAIGPRFTIRPATTPPPNPNPPGGPVWPRVDKVLDQNLNPKDVFTVGETIILSGGNFGSETGRLFVNGFQITPKTWTDTRIAFSFNSANRAHRIWVQIKRKDGNGSNAGGGSDSRPKMPFVVMPGETPLP